MIYATVVTIINGVIVSAVISSVWMFITWHGTARNAKS